MRKAQELSLNLIVVGALALLVLLIIGGVMVFGGGDLINQLLGIAPEEEDVAITSFRSTCTTKCQTLNYVLDDNDIPTAALWSTSDPNYNAVKNYCCESYDLDSDGRFETNGDLGPEICSLMFECRVGGQVSSSFCKQFTTIGEMGSNTCDLNTPTTTI
jgi:hypothetical protein